VKVISRVFLKDVKLYPGISLKGLKDLSQVLPASFETYRRWPACRLTCDWGLSKVNEDG
jgi:hypothetical protein